MEISSSPPSKSPNSEMSNSIAAPKYHLKPPQNVLIRKPPGPAETGHLTPRSRTTSASSASMMSPMSETRPSSETRLGLTAKQASSSSSILERSRSSGRLVPAVPLTSEAGQLKRTSAASTSALSRSSAGAPPSPTTPCTTQPPSSTPAAAATTAAASAGSTSSILSTQNQEQNGCSSVGNNRTEDHPSEQNTIGSHTPNKAKKENKAKSESKLNNSTASIDTDLEEIQRREKEKKVFKNWRNKASMSKLGKGTRSLLGKWKNHSQSVDSTSPHGSHPGGKISVNSDSLDNGLHGLQGSDPGPMDSPKDSTDKLTVGNGTNGVNMASSRKASKNKLSDLKHVHLVAPTDESRKKESSWSEHTWTAWVHRGFSDDVTELLTVQPGGDSLTDFQKDKFRYFFYHVLDQDHDQVISSEDFDKLNERMRHYMDWSVNSIHYLALKELHETFLECFLTTASNFVKKDEGFDFWDPFKQLDILMENKNDVTPWDTPADSSPKETKTCISIDEWIDVWGTIVGSAKRMDDFPMWLQYYPKVLFDIINRSGTGIITKAELKFFYTAFMDVGKLGDTKLEDFTNNAYDALTSNGELDLTFHIYRLSFLNFLLGKQANGPGQYLFGTVTPETPTCMFPIDYSAMNSTEEDLEPYRPDKLDKSSRRSVLV